MRFVHFSHHPGTPPGQGEKPMPIIIAEGWLKGHCSRRARKAHRCVYDRVSFDDRGKRTLIRCKINIQPGEAYAEGDRNDDAGGFGNDRFCLTCAGYDATGHLLPSAALLQAAQP
jgi:hypothetical protein